MTIHKFVEICSLSRHASQFRKSQSNINCVLLKLIDDNLNSPFLHQTKGTPTITT